MDRQVVLEEIKFRITGGVLKLEVDDAGLNKVIDMALRELQRYIDTSKFILLPYQKCIDLSGAGVSAVTNVYRTQGFGDESGEKNHTITDPMYVAQWQILSGLGNLANVSDYVYNYAAWNTTLQIRNTSSTDLSFIYDSIEKKLYINANYNIPNYITVEFVPEYKDVSDLQSPYWEDILIRLSVALTKIAVGRIRNRYTQSGALWSQDGAQILDEGNTELRELRETLQANTNLAYPID